MTSKIKKVTSIIILALSASFSIPNIVFAASNACQNGDAKACLNNGQHITTIMDTLKLGINFLAAAVGIIATTMLIYGGIQYITSNGNPQKVAKAKEKITNVIIGFVAFVFLYALMQWLIPGGIFS